MSVGLAFGSDLRCGSVFALLAELAAGVLQSLSKPGNSLAEIQDLRALTGADLRPVSLQCPQTYAASNARVKRQFYSIHASEDPPEVSDWVYWAV